MPGAISRRPLRCLCIDDLTSGRASASGRPFFPGDAALEAVPFCPGEAEDLWDRLRSALQALRREAEAPAVVARGTGCAAALALAEQLPVGRLALIDPVLAPRGAALCVRRSGGDLSRLEGRLCRFARRNLSLCASDILVAARPSSPGARALRPGALGRQCRLTRLALPDDCDENMLKKRENMVNQAISGFLRTGELPKPLAQNPEMCIIYG